MNNLPLDSETYPDKLPTKRNWTAFFTDYKSWIGIIISIFFIWLVLRRIELDQLYNIFTTVTLWPILPAILIYFCGVYFRSLRWFLLLRPLQKISIWLQFKVICLGYMANNILPFRAGELYRAHVLGTRTQISRTAVFSSIILERVFDGLVMLFFLGLSVFYLPQKFPSTILWITYFSLFLFGGLFILCILVVLYRHPITRIISWFTQLLPVKIGDFFLSIFAKSVEGLTSLKGITVIMLVFLVSVLSWFCEAAMYYFLFFSLHLGLSYGIAVFLVAIINLGIMIPSSPGYIGTFEYFCVITLSMFSVADNVALSYSLLLHFLLLLPITLVGSYYFSRLTTKKSSLS